jgi:hypothetical protein
LASATALGATLRLTAWLAACCSTSFAFHTAVKPHLLCHATCNFFQGQRHVDPQVIASPLPPAAATTEKVTEYATAKYVTEGSKDILCRIETVPGTFNPGVTKAIVPRPLFLIAQHLVSFRGLFEQAAGIFIARIRIGVVLHRQLAISPRYFPFIGVSLNPEYFVIIAFGHRSSISPKSNLGTHPTTSQISKPNQSRRETNATPRGANP